jgi:hypothetical protein
MHEDTILTNILIVVGLIFVAALSARWRWRSACPRISSIEF